MRVIPLKSMEEIENEYGPFRCSKHYKIITIDKRVIPVLEIPETENFYVAHNSDYEMYFTFGKSFVENKMNIENLFVCIEITAINNGSSIKFGVSIDDLSQFYTAMLNAKCLGLKNENNDLIKTIDITVENFQILYDLFIECDRKKIAFPLRWSKYQLHK